MNEKEYIIFCDESDVEGEFYSNFYGGVIVGASQYERVSQRLNEVKHQLNLFGEVKWGKVTERYLPKYQELMRAFFAEIAAGHVRVRLMFRQNAHKPRRLSHEQTEMQYFLLYYQFIKHAFGLECIPHVENGTGLRLYFDKLPDTREKVERFKGFIQGLQANPKFRATHLRIAREDIAEVRSHDHVLLQCLDVALGAISFRVNDRHKAKPLGASRRGKRTRAKEKLYRGILQEIRRLRPRFNIGVNTATTLRGRWEEPYLHWLFQPKDGEFETKLTKRGGSRK